MKIKKSIIWSALYANKFGHSLDSVAQFFFLETRQKEIKWFQNPSLRVPMISLDYPPVLFSFHPSHEWAYSQIHFVLLADYRFLRFQITYFDTCWRRMYDLFIVYWRDTSNPIRTNVGKTECFPSVFQWAQMKWRFVIHNSYCRFIVVGVLVTWRPRSFHSLQHSLATDKEFVLMLTRYNFNQIKFSPYGVHKSKGWSTFISTLSSQMNIKPALQSMIKSRTSDKFNVSTSGKHSFMSFHRSFFSNGYI